MKKFCIAMTATLSIYSQCFSGTASWTGEGSDSSWSTVGNWNNLEGGTPFSPSTGDCSAIINFSNFVGKNTPENNANITLKQLQFLSGSSLNTTVTNGETLTYFSTTLGGTVSTTVTAANAHVQFKGLTSIQNELAFLAADNYIRFWDINQAGFSGGSRLYSSNTGTNDLLNGVGTAVVGANTVLTVNPTVTDSGYTNSYAFNGTVNLQGDGSTLLINNAKGNHVADITGSNLTSLVRIEDDTTFQKSHTYSGTTQIFGKNLTFGAAHTVDATTYPAASMPNSAILFSDASPTLTLSANAAVGSILESVGATASQINLGTFTLTVNQDRDSVAIGDYATGANAFSGDIYGTGGLTKAGASTLKLTAANRYSGPTIVNAGTVEVYGNAISRSSSVTVNSNGTLAGTGNMQGVTLTGGSISPGHSIGMLNTFNFASDSNSTTIIEVGPYASSQIAATGTASTQGTVTLTGQKGLFVDGTTHVILSSTGERTGTYTTFNADDTNFSLAYGPNSVSIIASGHHINPHPHHPGHHNSHHASNHLTSNLEHITFNGDIVFVINAALNHYFTAAEASDALVRLTGLVYHGLDRATVQTIERKARSVDEMFISRAESKSSSAMYASSNENSNRKEFRSVYGQNETALYLEPYVVIYHQGDSAQLVAEGQVPFINQVVGFGGGYELAFDDNYVFEIGAGYSFSALQWEHNFGHAIWNSLYLAPFLGWYDDASFVNGMILGQCNFNDVHRKVTFQGLDELARGKFVSYDLLLRLNGGHRWAMHRSGETTDWLQAEGTLNYINIFLPEIKETSTRSLELNIKSKAQLLLQPRLTAKWIHEIVTNSYILAPVLKMGWVGSYQLNEQKHHAKFALSPGGDHFISSGHEHINQMMVGGELFYKSPRNYKVTSGIETLFFDHTAVFEGSVKWEWAF